MTTAPRPEPPRDEAAEMTPLLKEHAAAAQRRSTRRKTIALMAFGALIIAAMLYRVGFGEVAALLATLGWAAPLILLPYAIGAVFDVAGWKRALVGPTRRAVSFWRLYNIRLVGEAVNSLTPTAGLAGEPIKAYLLRRHGVETGDGVASVVIAKTALITAQILFTLVGLVAFLDFLGVLGDRALLLAVAWLIGIGIAVLIVAGQRVGLVRRSARLLRSLGLRGSFVTRLEARAGDIDGALVRFYRNDPRGFLAATAWHMLAWIVGIGEVVLLLELMGLSCTWLEALIIESITQATMASGAIVPGGLGVQEFSGAVLCRILGIGEAGGLALMLLKRIREIAFSVLGMVLLPYLNRKTAADQ